MADARSICDTVPGDGINKPFLTFAIGLSGTDQTVQISGNIQYGGSLMAITGSPLTSPAPPGSGSIYWIIQVNNSTGAATIKQSTTATPTPDTGNTQIFGDVVTPSDTSVSIDPSATTPDY